MRAPPAPALAPLLAVCLHLAHQNLRSEIPAKPDSNPGAGSVPQKETEPRLAGAVKNLVGCEIRLPTSTIAPQNQKLPSRDREYLRSQILAKSGRKSDNEPARLKTPNRAARVSKRLPLKCYQPLRGNAAYLVAARPGQVYS